MKEHRGPVAAIAAIGVVLAGLSLSVDYPRTAGGFWSDGATYYTMAHSLAFDGDLVFAREDVERVFREFEDGPSGIFLKKGRQLDLTLTTAVPFLVSEGPLTEELYFAKAFLYSLVAAPFVRLFGTNGLLLMHAVLFTSVLLAGYFFLAATNSKAIALAFTGTFFFASVAPAYFVWMTPELFNLGLVFLGGFFWLYKERNDNAPRLLRGIPSDLIAAAIWGAVTYSKPNNIFLIVPFLALLAWRRQWRRGVAVGAVFALFLGGLFIANLLVTGEMNYQGGERETFSGSYPFQLPHLSFDNTGLSMRTDAIYTDQPWDIIAHDVIFFYFGRFSGMVLYFFPAAAAIALFVLSGERRLFQWLVLAVATLGGLVLVVWSPTNYFGGAGTLGNRYFMNLYPLYFFLVANIRRPLVPILASWAAASVFLTSILIQPFEAGRRPGEHATVGAFKWFPPELSGINHLPTNSDPLKFRQRFDDGFLGYFLDNNTWGRERRSPGGLGFHVRGATTAEMVVRTNAELSRLVVRVTNVAGKNNRVRVCVPGGCETREMTPGAKEIVDLPAGKPFPYEDFGHRSYCYLVSIETETGVTPLLESRAQQDRRYVGAFVHIEPDPYPGL
jgi:hypothetical protein